MQRNPKIFIDSKIYKMVNDTFFASFLDSGWRCAQSIVWKVSFVTDLRVVPGICLPDGNRTEQTKDYADARKIQELVC